MSTAFYRMTVGDDGGGHCYSALDHLAANVNKEFERELFPELCVEMDKDYFRPKPQSACHVLKWDTDLDTKDKISPTDKEKSKHLHDLAAGRHIEWGLSDIVIGNDGYVDIQLVHNNPYLCATKRLNLYRELEFLYDSRERFCILFEAMGSGFARTRYLIKRYRDSDDPRPSKRQTVIEVVEQSSTGLLRRVFHFPDKGAAYCEIMECRR